MKETFYFPHDCNAIQDPKLMEVLVKCGIEAVGMYWILIEILHQQSNSMISEQSYSNYIDFYGMINSENKNSLDKIKEVLITSGLFVITNNFVISKRVLENKKQRQEMTEKRSLAGKAGMQKRWNIKRKDNSVITKDNSVITEVNNKRKGKEIKLNNNYSITTQKKSEEFFNNNNSELRKLFSNENDLNSFISYWTELNKSGTKQRWELEKTFEVEKRIKTWISRSNNVPNKNNNNNSVVVLHDGSRAIKRFDKWVDYNNQAVVINEKYFPELKGK